MFRSGTLCALDVHIFTFNLSEFEIVIFPSGKGCFAAGVLLILHLSLCAVSTKHPPAVRLVIGEALTSAQSDEHIYHTNQQDLQSGLFTMCLATAEYVSCPHCLLIQNVKV